ncbi:MAG: hypothetical protein J2P15_11230 [Micromonosporaceae bacterium]|nr:hypothetical protein [Micromonosporaceae bacterium]
MRMGILNITYAGRSADLAQPLDDDIADADVRRIAEELVRAGEVAGLVVSDLPPNAFRSFVVDRLADPTGTVRIYLRPKVPFGAGLARRG